MITKIRKHICNIYFMLPLCISFLLVSCSKNDNPVAVGQSQLQGDFTKKGNDYDGEVLFKGIMFHQGPVADVIPEIRDHINFNTIKNPELKQIAIEFNQRIISSIKTIDSQFFEKFKDGIKSGNHLIIAKTMDNAIPILHDALRQQPEYQKLNEMIKNNPERVKNAIKDYAERNSNNKLTSSTKIDSLLDKYYKNISTDQVLVYPLFQFVYLVAVVDVAVAVNYALIQAVAIFISLTTISAIWNYNSDDSNNINNSSRLYKEQLINSIAQLLKR